MRTSGLARISVVLRKDLSLTITTRSGGEIKGAEVCLTVSEARGLGRALLDLASQIDGAAATGKAIKGTKEPCYSTLN